MKAGHRVVAAGACREPAAVHRRDEGCARRPTVMRAQGLLAEFAQRVEAALEQLARDGQAGAVAAEPLGRLDVVVVVG